MMLTIDTTPDQMGRDLQRVLEGIASDFEDLSYLDVLNDTHKQLEAEHRAMFSQNRSPGGEPWQPLAPATVKRKGHATILVETGALRHSLLSRNQYSIRETVIEGRSQGIVFGTSRPFASIHQYGTERVPQRQHVGVNEQFVGVFAKRIAEAAAKKLAERRQPFENRSVGPPT